MRHQRHFAEAPCALVGIEDLVENLFATRRLGLDDAPLLKAYRDAFDQRTLIGERFGADHITVDPSCMWRGEDFLRRDICVAGDSVLRGGAAALPFMSVGKADRKVSTGSGKMQRAEPLAVQPLPSAAQHLIVLFPG